MNPRTALARVQTFGNLDLPLRIFKPPREVSGVNAILAEKLVTRGLCKQNVVLLTKLDRAPRPAIRLVVETVVLITARCVRVNLRDHRRGKSADTVTVRRRRDQFTGTQQQFDSFLVTTSEMVKARFSRERIRCFEW